MTKEKVSIVILWVLAAVIACTIYQYLSWQSAAYKWYEKYMATNDTLTKTADYSANLICAMAQDYNTIAINETDKHVEFLMSCANNRKYERLSVKMKINTNYGMALDLSKSAVATVKLDVPPPIK